MKRIVRIDAFPEAVFRCLDWDAIVAVDIISATTALVTSAAVGRHTFVAASVKAALEQASSLGDTLLAGEVGDFVPEGFAMPASPAALAAAPDGRPAVVLAPPGTQVLVNAASAPRVYVACLRNLLATARALAASHSRVAIIGAGQGRDLRSEDQLATAHLARELVEQGFTTVDPFTEDLLARWGSISPSFVALGRSAEQLRRTGRMEDLEFVMAHTDDIGFACEFIDGEVRAEAACDQQGTARIASAERASPARVVPFTIGSRKMEPGLST